MVSPIWKAASDGNLQHVSELLKDASSIDVEIKDHTGCTPLIQAVRYGHAEVVKALLQVGGADPFNSSSTGRPERYTDNQEILDLLADARNAYAEVHGKPPSPIMMAPPQFEVPQGYPEHPYGPGYYHPMGPPGADPNFPGYYISEGGYYPPPPPGEYLPPPPNLYAGPNVPPVDVAKSIPCRFFPACRYGSSCIFAHPQPSYGLPPPHHYPPYEHAGYPPPFYPPPPPNFSSGPPPPHMMSPTMSPSHHHHHHHRSISQSNSELPSPHSVPFSPPPHVAGYAMSPMTPSFVPSGMQGQHPPPPHGQYQGHPAPFIPQSPSHHRRDSLSAPYPQPPYHPGAPVIENDGSQPPQEHHVHSHGYNPRDGSFPARRGGHPRLFGRGSKGPCMFFPSGKCRNGDDCNFQHIIPQDGASYPRGPHGHGPAFNQRVPRPPRPFTNGVPRPMEEAKGDFEVKLYANGTYHDKAAIADHLASLPPKHATNGNGNGFARRPSEKPLARNGAPVSATKQQRVPNADDFPSLIGSRPASNGTTTPTTSIGLNGLTAAQILKSSPRQPKRGSNSSDDDDDAALKRDGNASDKNGHSDSEDSADTAVADVTESLKATSLSTPALSIEIEPMVA